MEQRSLRLGDIVDDYCPRERRVTNHAIVAIVEDAIRQTRCTTCDHEHGYKEAREPRRRKKGAESLFDEVLADVTGAQLVSARAAAAEAPASVPAAFETSAGSDAPDVGEDADEPLSAPEDGWPAHRTLIRATLPRTEGEPPPPRPIPEFTMHQRQPAPRGRGGYRFNHGAQGDSFGNARPGRGSFNGNGNGHGNGNPDGNSDRGNAPGAGRGRRRRGGKRPR